MGSPSRVYQWPDSAARAMSSATVHLDQLVQEVAGLLEILDPLFVLPPRDVLDHVALQKPQVILDDVVPWLDAQGLVVAPTKLLFIGCRRRSSSSRLVPILGFVNQGHGNLELLGHNRGGFVGAVSVEILQNLAEL